MSVILMESWYIQTELNQFLCFEWVETNMIIRVTIINDYVAIHTFKIIL